MTRRTKANFTQVDPKAQLAELRSDGLSIEDQFNIEEDFLHQGLEYWLNRFRIENELTQTEIAEAMGISQSAVCQMLKKPSRLATLSRLVTAMGGTIDITITRNGKTTSLLFGMTNEEAARENVENQVGK
jgi:predicted XRE-type DNA-binding protein